MNLGSLIQGHRLSSISLPHVYLYLRNYMIVTEQYLNNRLVSLIHVYLIHLSLKVLIFIPLNLEIFENGYLLVLKRIRN